MIKSMTGFGKGEARFKSGKVTVEIKTVNHKFFDATLKLPNGITAFEDRIKEIILIPKQISHCKRVANIAVVSRPPSYAVPA